MIANMADMQTAKETIPQYALNPAWLEEHGRSLRDLAFVRLCPKSQKKFKSGKDDLDPIAEISACCATTPGYFSPNLPLLEAIFRLLLSNDNKPLNLVDIGEALMGRKIGVDSPRDLSAQTLQRMLAKDTYYGIRWTDEQAEQPEQS